MNRNQLLKEVCALVKELGMSKSELARVNRLDKVTLEVEYNRLMALKNAPVAEVNEQPIEVSAPVAEVNDDRAMNITNKLLSDWDCYDIRENAQKYLYELILMVIGDCDKKIKHCLSAESQIEVIDKYFDEYIYNTKGNIDYIKIHVFSNMEDGTINDEFYYFIKKEIINVLVDDDTEDDVEVVEPVVEVVEPVVEQPIEPVEKADKVDNMPVIEDVEQFFEEVEQASVPQTKTTYNCGTQYFDNNEIDHDDDRDFGRWDHDDDDDRNFGRFKYYDRNYDKHDYNNNDNANSDSDNDDVVESNKDEQEVCDEEEQNHELLPTVEDEPQHSETVTKVSTSAVVETPANNKPAANKITFANLHDDSDPVQRHKRIANLNEELKELEQELKDIEKDKDDDVYYYNYARNLIMNGLNKVREELNKLTHFNVESLYKHEHRADDGSMIPRLEKRRTKAQPRYYTKLVDKNNAEDYDTKTIFCPVLNVNIHTTPLLDNLCMEKGLPYEHMIIQFNYIDFHDHNRRLFVLFNDHDQYREWFAQQTIARTFNETVIAETYRRIVFDIDRADSPFNMDELHEIRNVLAERVAQVFNIKVEPREFVVYTSQHPEEPKGSCHIISRTLTMRNFQEHKELYKRLRAIMNEEKEAYPWMKYIDWGICKSVQNLRLPQCIKLDSKRVKTFVDLDGINEADPCLFLTEVNDSMRVAPSIFNYDTLLNNNNDDMCAVDNKELEAILENEEVKKLIGDMFKFRDVSNNCINFTRIKASHCELCNRTHENDNTFYLQKIKKAGNIEIYAKCRHNNNKGSKLVASVKAEDIPREKIQKIYLDALAKRLKYPIDISIDADNIKCIQYSEDNMRPFEKARFIYGRGPMKCGKSKAFREYVVREKPQKIIDVCCRRTLGYETQSQFAKIGIDFVSYEDIEDREIDMNKPEYSKIIIQPESIHRLKNFEGAIVRLDEIESICNQLTAPTNKKVLDNFSRLKQVIKSAETTFCLDAFLSQRSHEFISRLVPPNENILMYYNNVQNMSNYHARVTCDIKKFTNILMEAIDGGKRIALMSNSKSYCVGIHEELKKKLGDKAVILYAGSDWHKSEHDENKTREAVKVEHMRNIDDALKDNEIRVMIMTPTISAGVSIELKGYFDKVFGYYTPNSCDVKTGLQMLGRVRDVAEREYTLYFEPSWGNLPTDIDSIFDAIDNRRRFLVDYDINKLNMRENEDSCTYLINRDDHFNRVYARNMIEHNKSVNFYGLYFCQLLQKYGCRIQMIEYNENENNEKIEKVKEAAKKQTREDYETYFNVGLNHDDRIKVMSDGFQPDINNPIEYQQAKKAKFMAKFDLEDIDMKMIDANIMREYDRNNLHYNVYRNLKDYYEFGRVTHVKLRYDSSCLPMALKYDRKEAAQNNLDGADYKVRNFTEVDSRRKYCIILLSLLGFTGIDDRIKLNKETLATNINQLMTKLRDNKHRDLLQNLKMIRPKNKRINLKEERFYINLGMVNGILQSVYGLKIKKTDRHKNSDDYHLQNLYFTPVVEKEEIKNERQHSYAQIAIKMNACVADSDKLL